MRIQGRTTDSPALESDHVYSDEENNSLGRERAPSQRESNIPEAAPQLNLAKEPYRSFNVFKDVC